MSFQLRFKNLIKKIFDKQNYQSNQVGNSNIFLTNYALKDGKQLISHVENNIGDIITLPVEKGRGKWWFKLNEPTYHPYIVASKMLFSGKSENQSFLVLKKFSDLSNSKNPNQTIGISKSEGFNSNCNHPLAFIFPWSNKSIEYTLRVQRSVIRKENNRYGLDSECFLGSNNCSDEKILIETERLKKLTASIKNQGYKISTFKPITGSLLIHENDWRFYIVSGQHRSAILASLGYRIVPVKIKSIIRRREVNDWKGVKKGIYSQKAALKFFDQMFYASPPSIYNDWCDFVDCELGTS